MVTGFRQAAENPNAPPVAGRTAGRGGVSADAGRRAGEAAVAGERVRGLAGHDLVGAGRRVEEDAEGAEAGGVVVAELGDRDGAVAAAHELRVVRRGVARLAE